MDDTETVTLWVERLSPVFSRRVGLLNRADSAETRWLTTF